MARWCTADQMRRWNGLPLDEGDPNYEGDDSLEYFIDGAQPSVRTQVSTEVINGGVSGDIDSVNTEYYVAYAPIFDENYDGSITASDLTVYGWGSYNDFYTKTELAVASINYVEGRFILSDAPSSTYSVLTVDYHRTQYKIDFGELEKATAHKAGWDYFIARYMEIPVNVRVGAQAYRMDSPAIKAKNAYLDDIAFITKHLIHNS